MRVTVGEISKLVQEAMSVQAADAWARTRGEMKDRATRRRQSQDMAKSSDERNAEIGWTRGDGARSSSAGNKLARLMRTAVLAELGSLEPLGSGILTMQELTTIKKMTQQELEDVIDDSKIVTQVVRDIAKWARRG